MAMRTLRPLRSDDFATLMTLEEDVFGAAGEALLGPYYIRLCCEFFNDTCFLAFDGERAVGYVLCFVKEREAYCATLAVIPEYQGSRVAFQLIRALISAISHRVDVCWFTVKEDNLAARALHASLGAREVEIRTDYYGVGDRRLVSRLERETFEQIRARLQRPRILDRALLTPTRSSAVENAA
jgi:ribosomal protein S18 acetylase RimI-like enzyme